MLSHFRHVQLFATPRTVAHQAPLSIGFSRQEYWSGLPFPSPGDLPESGIEPASLMSDRPISPNVSWNAVSFVPQVAVYPYLLEVSWIKCPIQQKIVCNVMHTCCCFSHIRLCNPMEPLGSSVHRILQARILEWVAMPSSRGSSWLRDRTCVSCDSCISGGFFTAKPPGRPLAM